MIHSSPLLILASQKRYVSCLAATHFYQNSKILFTSFVRLEVAILENLFRARCNIYYNGIANKVHLPKSTFGRFLSYTGFTFLDNVILGWK